MQKTDVSDQPPRERASLPLRERYLLEKDRIKAEIGDLEQIRLSLGLSKRRMCQLLLVDPSAWTRWNKTEAPPHVYQALRWLLELRKTNPSVADVPGSLDRRVDLLQASTDAKIRGLEFTLSAVERAVTFATTRPPAPAVPDGSLERSMRATEMRFQLEIANLKSRIDELLAAKPEAPKKARKRRKSPRPLKKASKKSKRVLKTKRSGPRRKFSRKKLKSRRAMR